MRGTTAGAISWATIPNATLTMASRRARRAARCWRCSARKRHQRCLRRHALLRRDLAGGRRVDAGVPPKSARDALVAAGVSEMGLWAMADIPCPYALFERVRGEVTALGGTVDSADYGADIRLTVSLPAENTAALR